MQRLFEFEKSYDQTNLRRGISVRKENPLSIKSAVRWKEGRVFLPANAIPSIPSCTRRIEKPFSLLLVFLWGFVSGGTAAAEPHSKESSFQKQLTRLEQEHRAHPEDETVLLDLAMLCYREAGYGNNAEVVPLAEKYLEELLAMDPENAYATALLGSTLTMYARDTIWPLTRLRHARHGNAVMDKAVAMAPDSVQVRWVRALNNFHMPAFLHRETIVRRDFTWMWEQITREDSGSKISADLKHGIAWFQGRILEREGYAEQAAKVWKVGLGFDPDGEYSSLMRRRLAEAKGH